MANTNSQAEQIRDLLVEKLEAYDPTLNIAEGSAFYNQVVAPVFSVLDVDPFDTDIEEFLLTRLRQEFPTVSAQEGDAIVDLLVRPLQLLLESFKRELQIIRTGQSVVNSDLIRLEDAEDLAANFFVERRSGSKATGTVRIYFSNPTFVSILTTATFTSSEGQVFSPLTPQFFRPETLAVQKSGVYYYIDTVVTAASEGAEYNIPANTLTQLTGVEGSVRCTNLYSFGGGSVSETGAELLTRTKQALTERALNTRRGIRARLFNDFPDIRNMEVVGFGDAEMQRDIVTGGGGMDVISSGMCFIVGRYVLLFSMFEDSSLDEDRYIEEGTVLDLNFWKFLYETTTEKAHQHFTVQEVIYNSKDDLESIPTVYILKIDEAPDVDPPVVGSLPGVLPGVFAVAYDTAKIRISDIPGGITNPDDEGAIVVTDGDVHIGGHYDVYLRPAESRSATNSLTVTRSEVQLSEGSDLVTSGEIPDDLVTLGALKNKVTAKYRLLIAPLTGTLGEGEILTRVDPTTLLEDPDTSAYALDLDTAEGYVDLACLSSDNVFSVNDIIVGKTTGATAVILDVESVLWDDLGVARGMSLQVISGADAGVYKILDVRGVELVLDLEMTVRGQGYQYRVVDESVVHAFTPKAKIYPFGEETANDLDTVIGSETVKVTVDLTQYGVVSGHTLEILGGDNKGEYTILDFDEFLGGKAPILDRALRATDSNLEYIIHQVTSGLTSPLVRIAPGGVEVLDASGQPAGFTVPPALPAGARAYQSFSGAKASYLGKNGFILPDPGPTWKPSGDVYVNADDFDPATDLIFQYSGGPQACYSGGHDHDPAYAQYEPCDVCEDGYVAVVTIADMPTSAGGHDVRVHLNIDIPPEQKLFLQQLRDWMVNVVENFQLGDDFRSFVDLFAPITFDPVDTSAWNILAQYEICLPKQLWDGCNNVFVAIPEFDWANEFADDVLFEDAMDMSNNGELAGTDPALTKAEPGSVLTVLSGSNAGSYIVDRVYKYSLVHGGTVQTGDDGTAYTGDDYVDREKGYQIAVVCIEDEFPVEAFRDLSEYMSLTTPTVALPPAPVFNVESIITSGASAGTVLGPWEVVQHAATWLFQYLTSIGFDVPDEFIVNPDSVLKTITQTFFTDYVVGHPTCEQMVRMLFTEPTSVTAYGSRPCEDYTWNETDMESASVLSAPLLGTVLPLPNIVGTDLTVYIKTIDGSTVEITEAADSAVAEAETAGDLVTALQELLDSTHETFTVPTHQEPSGDGSDPIAFIALTTVEQGQDCEIRVKAVNSEDGFRQLGFYDTEGGIPDMVSHGIPTIAESDCIFPIKDSMGVQKEFSYDETDSMEVEIDFDPSGASPNATILLSAIDTTGSAEDLTLGEQATLVSSGGYSMVTVVFLGYIEYPVTEATDHGIAFYVTSTSGLPAHQTTWDSTGDTWTLTGNSSGNTVGLKPGGGLYYATDATMPASASVPFTGSSTYGASLASEIEASLDHAFAYYLMSLWNGGVSAIFPDPTDYQAVVCADLWGWTAALSDNGISASIEVTLDAGETALTADSYVTMGFPIDSGAGATTWTAVGETHTIDSANYTLFDIEVTVDSDTILSNSLSLEEFLEINAEFQDWTETYAADSWVIKHTQKMNSIEHFSVGLGLSDKVEIVWSAVANSSATVDTPVGLVLNSEMTTDPATTTAAWLLSVSSTAGVATNAIGTGTSMPGEEHTKYLRPKPPTLFSTDCGASELLFVATASEDPFQVFPGESRSGKTAPTALPRDTSFSSHYSDAGPPILEATAFRAVFEDGALVSPLLAGVQKGTDVLEVYEQRTLLELADTGAESSPAKQDRVVAVTTSYNSNEVAIHSLQYGTSDFTFMTAESTLEADEVVPGDILFIEEGTDKGGYTVITVSDTALTLDRALTETTLQTYSSGNEGAIDEGETLTDLNSPFTSDDVGRYLTIYASAYENVDGSYQILEVSSDGATVTLDLSGEVFPVTETNVRWIVVKAPVDDVEDSEIDGFSALLGVRPIRIYSGAPTEWRVVDYHPSVSRLESFVTCSYGRSTEGPRRGHKQPYKITRPHTVHISSTAMKEQGRENGFYYFDVRARSLGGDSVYNLPKDTPLTPVFGTFDSDGYRFEVEDALYTYSTKEDSRLHFSSRFLPNELDDTEDNKISLEGATFSITHDFSELVNQVQSLLLSDENRILCADPLARHFIPSYVYLDVAAQGGDMTRMSTTIVDFINALEPEAVLDVSQMEKYLHDADVTSYSHPIYIHILTHDLDRRMVLTRSDDAIGLESAAFSGTHRTTFYIPGEPRTDGSETSIPDGERIYIRSRDS